MAISPGEKRIQQAMQTLQASGYTRDQAAGIVGNWMAEAGRNLNPQQVEAQDNFGNTYRDAGTAQDVLNGIPGPGTGYGLAQWTPAYRQNALRNGLKEAPTDRDGFMASIEAAVKEIAQRYPGFARAKSLEDSAHYGLHTYENPKDKSEEVEGGRIAKAKLAYNLGFDGTPEAPTKDPTQGNTWLYSGGPDQSLAEANAQAAFSRLPVSAPQSVGMSYTPDLPKAMTGIPDAMAPLAPGFNFSSAFGMGMPESSALAGAKNMLPTPKNFNERLTVPQTDGMREALRNLPGVVDGPKPGLVPYTPAPKAVPPWSWPQAPSYDPLSSIGFTPPAPYTPSFATPRSDLPGANPDWGTPGPGIPARAPTPDFTTNSDRTFQKTAPSVMSAPAESGPSGATLAGQSIRQLTVPSAIPQFSRMQPKMAAVTEALAADAQNKQLAEAYTPPSERDNMYGVAPTAAPDTTSTTAKPSVKGPQVQKVMRPIAPPPVFAQPAHPPSIPTTQKGLNEYGLGDTPGSQLSAAIGTPQDLMGSQTSPAAFAKAIGAISAINGNDDAQSYARQLYSNRPEIQGVAFDALANEYAQATNQLPTPTLYDRAASTSVGRKLGMTPGILPYNGIGASNSPVPQQGMWVQGAANQPVFANYSPEQQQAMKNSSGLWGSIQNALGFGAGANNGWGGATPGVGPGTSGLY